MVRIQSHTPTIKAACNYNAEKSPEQVAFRDATESITWKKLDEYSRDAANGLLKYAAQGDRIAFLCESSVSYIVALIGAMKVGCIVSNLHTKTSTTLLEHCITQLQPKVLIVDKQFTEQVDQLSNEALQGVATVITIGESDQECSLEALYGTGSTEEPDVSLDGDDPAFIWWTSGSTGRPKGWCHTHWSLYIKGMKAIGRTGIDPNSRSLTSLSPSFGAWTNILLRTVIGCESAHFMRDWDPEQWLQTVDESNITHSGMVVTMWKDVLDQDLSRYDLTTLDMIYTTGEKIDTETLSQLRQQICENIYQTYGSTEMTGTTLYNDQMKGDRIKSIGKPQMGTELRIIEEDGAPEDKLEPGEVGEIIIRGPDVPAWAWRDSKRTRETFRNGWWYSKDLGYKDEEGYVYLEGRADSMIKSMGMKMMPAPIESVLTEHPSVEEAVVVGVNDEKYGERVTAVIQTQQQNLTAEDLNDWCLESNALADHKRPRSYHFIDEVEKTSSGKVDRNATREKIHTDE
ncbi:class I adenylate-forming enzyme family protein [Halalkalicoccus salilacus]|uniref:class I adenylate-forming enzyme family protein n=1 Tax=Halalkalicoccus salilacus TaxID=3117459 RepID=UPI00300E7588